MIRNFLNMEIPHDSIECLFCYTTLEKYNYIFIFVELKSVYNQINICVKSQYLYS